LNIYVESNFVLELALVQEQHASCEEILRLSETGHAQLVIPAYSLAEPYETLVRRRRQRKQLKANLDEELSQLSRTATYSQQLSGFENLTTVLIDSADEEAKRLEWLQARLLKTVEVIPLDASILAAATRYQVRHDLSPQDALVYASVLSHLAASAAPESCFLNKNSKDFDDPDIVAELKQRNCKLIPRFDDGHKYVCAADVRRGHT
jgi:predicted nucleic acid-binding protein